MAFWKVGANAARMVKRTLLKYTYNLPRFSTKTIFAAAGLTSASYGMITFADSVGPDGKKCRVCRPLVANEALSATSMHEFLRMKPMAKVRAAAASDPQEIMKMTPEEYEEAFQNYTPPMECPPNYWELGQSTWNYLHTMAAYYPEEPKEDLKASMPGFIWTFALTYPCESCREHMQDFVKKHPPKVGNNVELSIWFCQLHNDVNRNLGKPPVPCTEKYLFERWRDGPEDGRCD